MVLNDDIINISNSFQDGCNTIVSGCTTYGSTPSSNSPADIVEAIKNISQLGNTRTVKITGTVGYYIRDKSTWASASSVSLSFKVDKMAI